MNPSVLGSRNRVSRFRRRPWRGHPYQWPCDRRPKIEKPGSADRRGGLEVVGNPTAFFMQ